MPAKSKAQLAYLNSAAEHGDVSHGMADAMPEHVKRMAHGGLACMSCGGLVGEHGYAEGGEFDIPAESDDEKPDMDDEGSHAGLVMAILRRKHNGSK